MGQYEPGGDPWAPRGGGQHRGVLTSCGHTGRDQEGALLGKCTEKAPASYPAPPRGPPPAPVARQKQGGLSCLTVPACRAAATARYAHSPHGGPVSVPGETKTPAEGGSRPGAPRRAGAGRAETPPAGGRWRGQPAASFPAACWQAC
ncbi:putative hydro-lyase KRH_21160 [Dama dama]|uniref:putative hydro-lyase KRH_21160 n=1 Tax=Dama dama TaxID=30532 RepID=UPI002A3675B1|nr:putative hydro-lyase KRH_21160 [Dama dama]